MNPAKPAHGGLVYSTEHGRSCPGCRRPLTDCVCGRPKPAPTGAGIVRVSRNTKGRGGKTVTVVAGVPLPAEALAKLATELRRACGSGGTVRDGTIEIQGDHAEALVADLGGRGYTVKRAGG